MSVFGKGKNAKHCGTMHGMLIEVLRNGLCIMHRTALEYLIRQFHYGRIGGRPAPLAFTLVHCYRNPAGEGGRADWEERAAMLV